MNGLQFIGGVDMGNMGRQTADFYTITHTTDSIGGSTQTRVFQFNLPVFARQYQGSRSKQGDSVTYQNTYHMTVLYCSDKLINEKMIVVYNGSDFTIQNLTKRDEVNLYFDFIATKIGIG